MRHTRSPDEMRHAIDVSLADAPGVQRHRWLGDAPLPSPRPWSAIAIELSPACDTVCVQEIERRLLSLPGVVGLGPHWPRPHADATDRTLVLRIYRGPPEQRLPR